MISPEIFYNLLKIRYNTADNPNILYVPKFFGAKDCMDFITYLHEDEIEFNLRCKCQKALSEKILLHDQEPMSDYFVLTYQQGWAESLKDDAYCINQCSLGDLSASWLRTTGLPLWCHSEVSSTEINELRDENLFLDVYYWYHGLIAQDWFRFWKYHPFLETVDRSRSQYRFLLYARDFNGTRRYRKTLVDGLRYLQPQILYHWDEQCTVSGDASASISTEDAQMSAIQIVAETLFDTQKVHLTEKVFKPMVMSQPFLILAGPGSLEYLRSYGFKTFSNFWDESYDHESDAHLRMNMILSEIDKISRLSDQEFAEIYQDMLPVIDHNRKWFFSDSFQDRMIKEMYDNFDSAFEKRQTLLPDYPGGQWFHLQNKMLTTHGALTPGNLECVKYCLSNGVDHMKIRQRYPRLYQYVNR
jgi:hypothetical protein